MAKGTQEKKYQSLTDNVKQVMTATKFYKTIKCEQNDIEKKANLLFADNYEVITICQAEGSKVIILAKKIN